MFGRSLLEKNGSSPGGALLRLAPGSAQRRRGFLCRRLASAGRPALSSTPCGSCGSWTARPPRAIFAQLGAVWPGMLALWTAATLLARHGSWTPPPSQGLSRPLPAYDSHLDFLNFSVPAVRPACPKEDRWRSSPTAFFSPVYPSRMGIARHSCVCLARGHLVWSLGDSGNFSNYMGPEGNVREMRPSKTDPRMPKASRLANCDNISKRHVHTGVTLLGQGWPYHVGHEQECVFPMLGLVQAGLADRMMYVTHQNMRKHTPFSLGLLAVMGLSFPTLNVEAGEAHCFDTVGYCRAPYSGWHSIRQSRLVPQASGQLVVPTRSEAKAIARRVQEYCNASDHQNASTGLQHGTILLRKGTSREMANVDEVRKSLMRYLARVNITYISGDLRFCTQAAWLWADVVVSIHGSHLVNQAFMRPQTHLIEVLPFLYEQDYNTAGCAPRHRHVLVGLPSATSLTWTQHNARVAQSQRSTHTKTRSARILVPVSELDLLLARIVNNAAAKGGYRCSPPRCAYV